VRTAAYHVGDIRRDLFGRLVNPESARVIVDVGPGNILGNRSCSLVCDVEKGADDTCCIGFGVSSIPVATGRIAYVFPCLSTHR
jgi:hypothetical protein